MTPSSTPAGSTPSWTPCPRPTPAPSGADCLFADGSLQEAGQILWADGSTSCVGRDLPPEARAYEWARRVDYSRPPRSWSARRPGTPWGASTSRSSRPTARTSTSAYGSPTGAERVVRAASVVCHLESRSTSFRYKRFLIERNRAGLVFGGRMFLPSGSLRRPASPWPAPGPSAGHGPPRSVVDRRRPDSCSRSRCGVPTHVRRRGPDLTFWRFHVAIYPTHARWAMPRRWARGRRRRARAVG